MKATKTYVSDTLGLCFWWYLFVWDLYFVYSCLEALFTGEFGFGRTNSIIDIEKRPGWFWFAFWFQPILGVTALPKILKQISNLKKLDVAREVRNFIFPMKDFPGSKINRFKLSATF